jgi:predicted component of viral defense system (DUF524 family)
MPDVLKLVTPDWTLSIWAKDIESSSNKLNETLASRGMPVPESTIQFSKPLHVRSASANVVVAENTNERTQQVSLAAPILFENKAYEFEFEFDPLASGTPETVAKLQPEIRHHLTNINDAFRCVQRKDYLALRGTINFGNNIGWFRLPLRYQTMRSQVDISLAFEVWPTKLDMQSDLISMNAQIDKAFPLWRFTIAEKTQESIGRSRSANSQFPLLWLSHFESLREELELGVKQVLNSPHSRLVSYNQRVPADRVSQRISARKEEAIISDLRAGRVNPVLITKKRLSVDTAENRFVKMVLNSSARKLLRFEHAVASHNNVPDQQRISDAFSETLAGWRRTLTKSAGHSMFREVGSFTGLNSESLVLQNRFGYSKIYRAWISLKRYFYLLGDDSAISVRNIAQLYEIWCFLTVRDTLIELGFEESLRNANKLKTSDLGTEMQDGITAAFEFSRADGTKIRLAHEPVFSPSSSPNKSWTVTQKPDILLEATLKSGDKFIWLFDAKYRVNHQEINGSTVDKVPEDAINQMHRYRDALIHQNIGDQHATKSRPVFGAFALYPGAFKQTVDNVTTNPYTQSIREVSIGAFPLLPPAGAADCGTAWLKQYLTEKLGNTSESLNSDDFYVADASRIPLYGTQTTRHKNLCFIAFAAVSSRSKEYIENIRSGKATWYHTRESQIPAAVISELNSVVIPTYNQETLKVDAWYIYPIKTFRKRLRKGLTEYQTGTSKIKNPESQFWLLELGEGRLLTKPVLSKTSRKFNPIFVDESQIYSGALYEEMSALYPSVLS